jgi:hypothetical protein
MAVAFSVWWRMYPLCPLSTLDHVECLKTTSVWLMGRSCRNASPSLPASCIELRLCWCPNPTGWWVLSSVIRVDVPIQPGEHRYCFSFFLLFPYLWSPRTEVLYFFCFINETHTVLCCSFKQKMSNIWTLMSRVVSHPFVHQPLGHVVTRRVMSTFNPTRCRYTALHTWPDWLTCQRS